MTCGTHAGYYAHKRASEPPCEPCHRAYRRWNKAWKVERERTGPRMIDATPVRTHIAQLLAGGMSLRGIGKAAGVSASTLANLTTRGDQRTVSKATAIKVLAVTGPDFTRQTPDDEGFVPKAGAVRRIRALLAIGWTHAHMRSESGVLTHVLVAQSGTWITVRNHVRIAQMYDRLSMTPGPSNRTRKRAAALGYLPPLAWDDDAIDLVFDGPPCQENVCDFSNPEQPLIDEVALERFISGDLNWRSLSRAERLEVAVRMDRAGVSRNVIAERTHLNTRTLWDHLRAASASEHERTIAS